MAVGLESRENGGSNYVSFQAFCLSSYEPTMCTFYMGMGYIEGPIMHMWISHQPPCPHPPI